MRGNLPLVLVFVAFIASLAAYLFSGGQPLESILTALAGALMLAARPLQT